MGVRELKTDVTRIIRQVRDAQASYVVTHRGEPVGLLTPLDADPPALPASQPPDEGTAWENFVAAGRRIGRGFAATVGGVEALSRMRR